MSLAECASIVQRADPDRFLAIMAAPVPARAQMFPLAAFNIEVARAPWLTKEPLIAQMRLQWWQDAIEEIAAGKVPRKHEVVEPLALALQGMPAGSFEGPLKALIAARQWDIYTEPFADEAAFLAHMDATGGGMLWSSALALGARPAHEGLIRGIGVASAIANWLTAASELAARGRVPLVDDSSVALRGLADRGLWLIRAARGPDFGSAVPALRMSWRAAALLRRVHTDPDCVAAGTLGTSEFQRRSSLMWRAFTGRW